MKKKSALDNLVSKTFKELVSAKVKKPGLSPGTVVYTGISKSHYVDIDVYQYSKDSIERILISEINELNLKENKDNVTWINVNGVHDVDLIKNIGQKLAIHPLFQEEISSVNLRPSFDEINEQIMVSLKMLRIEKGKLKLEHVSLIAGKQFVISFQEYPGDVFEPIRKRLKVEQSRIRGNKTDYLLYVLLDAIIDNYFVVLEFIGEKLELLEDKLEENFDKEILFAIQDQKREIIKLRRSVYPLREVIAKFEKSDSDIIYPNTQKYIRDLYDHTIQVIETTETFREFVSSLSDLYNSGVSLKMNNIMQVLTIIATIFIPLTFIAGIYGMNFDNMPELHWEYGYFGAWGIMLTVLIGMLFYFRNKKWL